MAKLYWTSEVKEIMDSHLGKLTNDLLNDKTMNVDQVARAVMQLRLFHEFADEIIADMEEKDRVEDEERAARMRAKAEKEAAENGTEEIHT